MHIVVTSEGESKGTLTYSGITVPCALGKGGVALEKEEGDGKTPLGTFPLRRVFYRPDRIEELHTGLPHRRQARHEGERPL